MDGSFFPFDFDDDFHHDDTCTDHNPSTTTNTNTTTTTAMPGGSHGKTKLISRPNRNDVLCGRG